MECNFKSNILNIYASWIIFHHYKFSPLHHWVCFEEVARFLHAEPRSLSSVCSSYQVEAFQLLLLLDDILPWDLLICTQCVWVAILSSQKWYDHSRCRSWIRGLKPPRVADLFTRREGLISGTWRHHIEIAHTITEATLTLPASCELSTWTQWPPQINKAERRRGGKK